MVAPLVDDDADGYGTCDGDCDDADAETFPGGTESCDGKDNDCDGTVPPEELDADSDGFTPCGGDCDDADYLANPSGRELPGNRRDENCDGVLVCDPAAGWRNQGQFVRCVRRQCLDLVRTGAVSASECASLVSKAARIGFREP